MTAGLWDRETFVEKLREVGACSYHDKHPFQRDERRPTRRKRARLGCESILLSAQHSLKDAAILSNCPLPEVRRGFMDCRSRWHVKMKAESKHGFGCEACSLSRDERCKIKIYSPSPFLGRCLREFRPQSAVASRDRLIAHRTFCSDLMTRLAAEKFIPGSTRGLDYFRRRVTQARLDSSEALQITIEHCNTPELQDEAARALQFKCDVLWCMLDAIQHAYADIKAGFPKPEVFRTWSRRCLLCARL
jgi:pyrroloquinoline-quinone synthase